MISQMILPAKGFPTDVTRVRSLVRVSSLVNQQIVALGELSVAEFANKLLLRSLTGQPSRKERSGRRYRKRWMYALMTLLMIRMRRRSLRATTPDSQ